MNYSLTQSQNQPEPVSEELTFTFFSYVLLTSLTQSFYAKLTLTVK